METRHKKFPNAPAVSVILPVYNRSDLIERAVQSVLGQTVADWELLITDDGSSDGLAELAMAWCGRDARIRYLYHSNRKLSSTRNIGIHAAMGDYLTFLDSDDEYLPSHLELRLKFMKSNPKVDFIHGGVELVGPPESHYVQDALDPNRQIHISECCVGATFFGKRQSFLQSGGFALVPYSAESEFLPRIEKSFIVKKVDFPTYRYYTGRDDSICAQRKREEL